MKKLSIDTVRAALQKEGYRLLSKDYEGARVKIAMECNKGHQYSASFDKFHSGHRCPECYRLRRCLSYREVKSFFEAQGYLLLSNEYKNSYTKILIECDSGHQYKVRLDQFKQGNRCPECSRATRRLSFEAVKLFISQEGYELLSNKYVNNTSPLSVKCNRGHKYEVRFSNFQQGKRCPECSRLRKCLNVEQARTIVEKEPDYRLISTKYRNYSTKLLVECDKYHQYWTSLGNFRTGHRCSQCNETRGERALRGILVKIFLPEEVVAQSDLGFLGRQRVDFTIPKLGLALEYDGEQHFRPIRFGGISEKRAEELFKECQRLDKQKEDLCQENGIRLIRFRYDSSLTVESVSNKINEKVWDDVCK